jgi:hypothetical protein
VIESLGIRNKQPMRPTPQFWPMRLRNQMKMVAHQNKAANDRLKASRGVTERGEKASAITFVMKDCLPCVAPCAKMINGLFKSHTQRTKPSPPRQLNPSPMSNV